MVIRLFIVILLALFSTVSFAGWDQYYVTDNDAHYVDYDTIKKSGGKARLWYLSDAKKVRNTPAVGSYLSFKALAEYDCRAQSSRILSASFYDSHMGHGNNVHNMNSPQQWSPVVPDTLGQALFDLVCKSK